MTLFVLLLACRSDEKVDVDTGSLDTGSVVVDTGSVDTGCETSVWYVDGDGDGHGGEAVEACEQPSGSVSVAGDCDDGDAAVFPGAIEACNDADDDCDGDVDEDLDGVWYADADGDGYGDVEGAVVACDGSGFVADASDCDDANSDIHPGADEVCDGLDGDCDGAVDEEPVDGTTWYADDDEDGYGDEGSSWVSCSASGGVAEAGDCDDTNGTVNPGAEEVCNEVDDDCSGDVDVGAVDAATWYADADGDGFGDPYSSSSACSASSGEVADGSDCDDGDSRVNPDADEVCNGIDDDCSGTVDEGASDATIWYADADGDGYGDGADAWSGCSASGGVADASDCDDGSPDVNPGAEEVCNGIDDDCSGDVDDGASDESTWYLDHDGDGYGDDDWSAEGCTAPTSAYVGAGGDCDDGDAEVNPGASEGCDGVDHDCDGAIDNDADGDGYSDAACGGTDCEDGDASVVPEVGGGCALGEDCLDVLESGYSEGDGTYTIDPDGWETGEDPVDVWCDMTTDGGGWTLVGDDDYSVDSCPGDWVADEGEGVCQRGDGAGSSRSASFSAYGVTYGEVMGGLVAYQYASTNAFWYTEGRGLDDWYVDGISLTVGEEGTREHVFTYAVGYSISNGYDFDCPSVGGIDAPEMLGDDWACASGNSGTSFEYSWYAPALFSSDDFQVELDAATSEDVEVRLMCDEESSSHSYSEDVGVASIELYVR